MMILRGGHIPTNNRTHQQRHSSDQPERSCGEEICIDTVHLKRTGCYAGFLERAFRGRDEPMVRSNGSICKGIPLKRTKRGKSGERLYPVCEPVVRFKAHIRFKCTV